MAKSDIFVGRKEELEEFKKVLEDRQGQAIIVVGNRGMGKTWLVNRMAKMATEYPKLQCGWVRYEVTPTDSPDSTMEIMMDNAFEAGQVTEGSFDGTKRGVEQWRSFLNVFNLGDLVISLRREPTKDTRQQFLERLKLISGRMPENGRAIFIIDPEKYMAEKSDQTWAIVVKNLSEKIKFIFAQRTEDEIVKGRAFKGLKNVIWIPKAKLDVLASDEVDDLVRLRAKEVGQEEIVLRGAVKRYKGHPYAIQAALGIIEKTKKVEGLPHDPTEEGVAEGQWEQVSDIGKDAIKLFEAYVVLEVAVPDDVVECVSELGTTTRKQLQGDKYLRGLLREESGGRRIYHSILADYILGQMSDKEKREYHSRAVEVYRGKLKKAEKEQTKPDELAAVRLPEHVLAVEGTESFAITFANECFAPLRTLGMLDTAMNLSKRILDMVPSGSMGKAIAQGNLGMVHEDLGDIDKAMELYTQSLQISEAIGFIQGMEIGHRNIAGIYLGHDQLDEALSGYQTSLELAEKCGNKKGIAADLTNIAIIYGKKNRFKEAYDLSLKSLDIYEKLQDLDGIGTVLGNLGNIYLHNNRLQDARKTYTKAVKCFERIGCIGGILMQCTNLAIVYSELNKREKAIEILEKARNIADKAGYKEREASILGNLGRIYQKEGQSFNAKECWLKALELYKKIGMPHMVQKVQGWIESIKEK